MCVRVLKTVHDNDHDDHLRRAQRACARTRAMEPRKRKSSDKVFGPKPLERARWSNAPRLTPLDVSFVAATLRRELRDEGGKPPDRPTNHQPRPSKELLIEAHLLLQLSGKIVGDCGVCANCLDKRKFGGLGVRKRACRHKVKFQYAAPSAPAPSPS